MSEIFRAKQPFMFVGTDGAPRHISVGDLVSSDDPGYKGREKLFEKVSTHVDRVDRRRAGEILETATAAPGEKRSVTLPPPSPPAQEPPKSDDKGSKSSPPTSSQSSGPTRGSAGGNTRGSK